MLVLESIDQHISGWDNVRPLFAQTFFEEKNLSKSKEENSHYGILFEVFCFFTQGLLIEFFQSFCIYADLGGNVSGKRIQSTDYLNTTNTCSVCGTTFTRKNNLIQHIRKQHPDEKIVDEKVAQPLSVCLECEFNCRTVNDLKDHLTSTHAFQFEVEEKVFENQTGKLCLSLLKCLP